MSRVTDLEREMIKHITKENEVLSSLLVRICEKLKVDETDRKEHTSELQSR